MLRSPDYMIDIETLGTGQDAVILSIGVVGFDPHTGVVNEDDKLYLRVDWKTQDGRKIDTNTLDWWLSQNREVMDETMSGSISLSYALAQLSLFLPRGTMKGVWCNGANFDFGILSHAYKQIGEIAPWKYSQEFCMRSLRRLIDMPEFSRTGNHHNALDDAVWQADWVCAALKKLKNWNIAAAAHGKPCDYPCAEHANTLYCKKPYNGQ